MFLEGPRSCRHLITCGYKDQPKLDLWVLVNLAEDLVEFLAEDKILFFG